MSVKELVMSIYDRMENKLKDIERKNLEKVEDPEKLKEAIAKALEEVKRGREEMEKLLEDPSVTPEVIDSKIKETVERAKQYLGKDYTGLKTAKATFSRCVNMYKKKVWPEIEKAFASASA